jgi:hypothetical protein
LGAAILVAMARTLTAWFLAIASLSVFAPAVAQATVVHVWRSDVDGDGHIETVRLVRSGHAHPRRYHLQLIDRVRGRRVGVRLSPDVDWMSPRNVIIRDFNGLPKRKEMFYSGTQGNAGGPTYAGIVGWDGGWLHHFWRYAPPYRRFVHDGHRTFAGEGYARPAQLRSGNEPAWEIRLDQGRYVAGDSMCCPRFALIRRYRYDPTTRSWVVYRRWWRDNGVPPG